MVLSDYDKMLRLDGEIDVNSKFTKFTNEPVRI
jgi:hypothetical protein